MVVVIHLSLMTPPPSLVRALEVGHQETLRLQVVRSPTPVPQSSEAPLFLRLTEDGQGLETAIATYQRPSDDKVIHLVGAVHVGEPDYFQALQMFLDRTGHVFYERSNDPEDPLTFLQSISGANAMLQGLSLYHKKLAERLGLKYQLDAMSYDRPHFKRVDMARDTAVRKLNSARGLHRIPRQLQLYHVGLVGVVGARADVHRQTRAQFAQYLVESHTRGGSSDFIDATFRGYRNKLVQAWLNQWSCEHQSELGVFYGAGHMRAFDRHITSPRLGYVPVETQWLRAF